MTLIATIDEHEVTADEFVKLLKFSDRYHGLVEDMVADKLTVAAAKRHGIKVTADEVQERFDEMRRIAGLHRAADTNRFLDEMGLAMDDFEQYVIDSLHAEKMLAEITDDKAIEDYFNLHSPKFDTVELSHIVADAEGKARELLIQLGEEPESFADLAKEHSVDDYTSSKGGFIGKVMRGELPDEVEARVFNAAPGALLGPFASEGELVFDIYKVERKNTAKLDEETAKAIRKLLREQWLAARAQEHRLEIR